MTSNADFMTLTLTDLILRMPNSSPSAVVIKFVLYLKPAEDINVDKC